MNRTYLIVCLALLPLAVLFSFGKLWTLGADLWETAATIRAVSEDIAHPANPMLALPGYTSPRFTPYTVLWGALMRLTDLDIFAIIGLAGIANYLLLVTGLARFARRQFQDQALPAYVLLTMLIVWGTGYGEANAYQLAMFLQTLPLVAIFAYGVCFHALASLRAYIDEPRWPSLVIYVLCSLIAFVTHPITGAFGFVAATAMLLGETSFKRAILFQVIPLLALIAAVFWPYFDYIAVLTKGTTEAWYKDPIFSSQFEALGMAVAGVPIALWYALKRRHLFLVYGLAFCLLIYMVSKEANIQIGSRFILYAAIFMHMAIAVYVREQKLLSWHNLRTSLQGRGLAFVFVFVLLVPALWFRAREMKWTIEPLLGPPFHRHAYESPAQPFLFLSHYLGSSDVVMADDTTGWVIPAITGAKLVAQLKGNPLISQEVKQRREEVRLFFRRILPLEERWRLLQKYRVTHILLDRKQMHGWDKSFLRDLPSLSKKVTEQGMIELYKVRSE